MEIFTTALRNKQVSEILHKNTSPYSHSASLVIWLLGKISAQPHPKLCIQFLNREHNDKKQYISVGKTDLFYNSMGLCGNFTAWILRWICA